MAYSKLQGAYFSLFPVANIHAQHWELKSLRSSERCLIPQCQVPCKEYKGMLYQL